MRLIRHLTATGPAYASLLPDGSALPLTGHPFAPGGLHSSGLPALRPGKLLAPVLPTAIFGIGLNYRRHAEEVGRPLPVHPMIFMKPAGAVQNPGDPILLPRALRSDEVDYEGELAVVIGRNCKNVRREHALDHVLGYTIANDVSARDWQHRLGGGQFCQGKSFDTFCPLGPLLVTTDELPDPGRLALRTFVNGELRQDSSTSDLIFDVPALISFLSASKTLLAGTVILTGTPSGVGAALNPPRFLQPGDTVSIEIESLGTLTNSVCAETISVP
ncbi:5-carboxymethyl-2-hydroxymuconate isomerase [Verrucomicrobia bacterium IMCC26134]|jgi:2-keto-4-pentenoate hydratase/2-oxohepta-3-ene-1,7-dioic acid hydratase in catechol pathway|nr:5-carboxymethyl-2-hydroxymuconate isomerase [Verrucomicrobia bacterium IMCC26134]